MNVRNILLLFSCMIIWRTGFAQNDMHILTSGKNTSIRALTVLDDHQAWVAGSNGWVANTSDQGKDWKWMRVLNADTLDFRILYAFDHHNAIIASAGTPFIIFRTEDGGSSWHKVYEDFRKEIFMDGVDFWEDGKGLIYGDAIGGKMQLLFTEDYGQSWVDISKDANLEVISGEAGFAASGTGIRAQGKGKVWIATGGSQARIWYSQDYGVQWKAVHIPIRQGTSSQGIFSIAISENEQVWAVGGDYLVDTATFKVGVTGYFQSNTWSPMENGPFGYRSCVELLDDTTLIACGTTGIDVSQDGGLHWENYSSEGFHVVRKARKGNWVLLAGSNGRIAEITGLIPNAESGLIRH